MTLEMLGSTRSPWTFPYGPRLIRRPAYNVTRMAMLSSPGASQNAGLAARVNGFSLVHGEANGRLVHDAAAEGLERHHGSGRLDGREAVAALVVLVEAGGAPSGARHDNGAAA